MGHPLLIAALFFLAVISGALCGWAMRSRVPEHYLNEETRNVVSVSMAVVATISALVLGLLISNANNTFIAIGGEVTSLSAQIIRLDHLLQRYGSDSNDARALLRTFAERKSADLFPDNGESARLSDLETYSVLQQLEDAMLALKPKNERDKWWLGQALSLAGKIGDTGWLMTQQVGQGTPRAFVILLAFWLASLFASFGLFGPRNRTTVIFITACALAVSAGVGMILELERGLGSIVSVSPAPMRYAVLALRADALNDQLGGRADVMPSRPDSRATRNDL